MSQLYNHIKISCPEPTVGMGATIIHWTDRSPATVVRISKSGKTCWIKADKAERVDSNGMSEAQEYTYTPHPEGKEIRVFKRKCGQWFTKGGEKVGLGRREKYHDYSF